MGYECSRCGHRWKPRKEGKPRTCPNCKSPYWDKLKQKISKEVVEYWKKMIINTHDFIIDQSGGELGIRDGGGLHHAAYKIIINVEKNKNNPPFVGASVYQDLAKRNYFIDGNKRTAHCFAKIVLLILLNWHLRVGYKRASTFIMQIANHEDPKSFNEIKKWIEENLVEVKSKDLEIYLKEIYFEISNKVGGD